MDTNDDFYGKELNLNCFYMHTNFGQKYPKTAIVSCNGLLVYNALSLEINFKDKLYLKKVKKDFSF